MSVTISGPEKAFLLFLVGLGSNILFRGTMFSFNRASTYRSAETAAFPFFVGTETYLAFVLAVFLVPEIELRKRSFQLILDDE